MAARPTADVTRNDGGRRLESDSAPDRAPEAAPSNAEAAPSHEDGRAENQSASPAAIADGGAEAGLAPGTLVSDRYRIDALLGEGGMGAVYSAEHVHMRKQVAVKVLHPEMCETPEVVARFEREAIAAAHIEHPNVAAATDFGRLPSGACFLVLEYLRGTSLRDEIGKGPIPPERALRILRGIASGAAAAHAKGIIHRDLKPENVMLVERADDPDFVKVLDFGIAKLDMTAASAPTTGGAILTRAGAVFGTPEYMAPEQAVGDTVDARADLYALGVILLEMVNGKCPFQGTALSIIRERVLNPSPIDFATVAHPGIRSLLAKLLVREPQLRIQTASELVTAINEVLAGRWSSLPPPSISIVDPVSGAAPSATAATSPNLVIPKDLLRPGQEPAIQSATTFAVHAASAPTSLALPTSTRPPGSPKRLSLAIGLAALSTVVGFAAVLLLNPMKRLDASAASVTPPAETTSAAAAPPAPPVSASVASASSATPASPAASTTTTGANTSADAGASATLDLDDDDPAPTPSAATSGGGTATPRAPHRHKPTRPRRPAAAPKKSNGGIHIPPPKDWF